MTDSAEETNEGAPEAPPKTETAGEPVAFAEEEVRGEVAEPAKEPDPLEVAKAESAKFREQLLRTAADFDNFRKRARREVDEAARKGLEKALKELLPVFDNLERATVSAEQAPDVKSVADGLKMVGRQFTSTLEKLQVKRIQAVGTPFDPTQHEAIQHVESTEHAAGVVTNEVQAGYLVGEVLLRAAMVVVSKGPPAAAAGSADGVPDEGTGAAPPADGEAN
jgi:molecular chaperone GrpE